MTIRDRFDAMDYGPAPESAAPAEAWLEDHGRRFGCFIAGTFTRPGETFATVNPATGEGLAQVTQAAMADVDAAVSAAHRAQAKWAALPGHTRARHLYALARLIQKHAKVLALLETLDTGKPIRESRDVDVPLAARHFSWHAGVAQLLGTTMPGHEPVGVCGQIVPWNFPLLMLAWKVAPALACGNTVVLKPAEWTPLTALFFGEICREAGLPKGVVNVVTGDGTVGEAIVIHPGVHKVAFTGSTEVGRRIRALTAGTGKLLTLELGGKSPFIVFEDADLDSAVEGCVDSIWLNQGEVCCAGSRLLVQEGVEREFIARLRRRMEGLRTGDPLDKSTDLGALAHASHLARVNALLEGAPGDVFRASAALPATGSYCAPTLITGLAPADRLMQEEIFGPVLAATTFRTPDEAVQIANATRYGLAASLWTEGLGRALEVAGRLRAGVVWVNGANLFDAAAGFGGVKDSGIGREGGWEGVSAYLRPRRASRSLRAIAPVAAPAEPEPGWPVDRTAKLYIGGRQLRPDGGLSIPLWSQRGKVLGHVPQGGRKDIRNAVEAAQAARAGWAGTTAYNRAQVLYYLAENLAARATAFATLLHDMTGARKSDVEAETAAAVARLFTWAAWADKYDGRVKPVPMKGLAAALHEPVGVIGAICPDEAPLLGTLSCLGPALAMGNCCVLVPSQPFPLAALDLVQVLEASDIPAGVVNIVTGPVEELARTLAGHGDVEAVWCFGRGDLSRLVEAEAAVHLKRTWVNHGRSRDWAGPDGEAAEFLEAATTVKTIWLPAGA